MPMTTETQHTNPESRSDLDQSKNGMGSDLVLAMNSKGIIVNVCCHHLDVLLADIGSLVGEHVSKFIPEELSSRLNKIMLRSGDGDMSQSCFSYHATINGVTQEFSCELIGFSSNKDSDYRWVALINRVSEGTYDSWLLRSKNRLLFAVSQASEALMSDRGFAEVVNESLYFIGNGIGVDRVYFFAAEHDDANDKIFLSQKFEWCSDSTASQIDNPELKKADMSLFEDMWSQLIHDRPFKEIVSKMPDNFTRGILSEQDIKALLTIPIFVEGKMWGMLGFDDCQYERNWSGVDIAVLKMVATMISAKAGREKIQF